MKVDAAASKIQEIHSPLCAPLNGLRFGSVDADFKWNAGDLQSVPIFEFAFVTYNYSIHIRTVLTSEISNMDGMIPQVEQELAVMAADELVLELQIAIACPPDQVFGVAQRGVRRFEHEFRFLPSVDWSKGNLHSRIPWSPMGTLILIMNPRRQGPAEAGGGLASHLGKH